MDANIWPIFWFLTSFLSFSVLLTQEMSSKPTQFGRAYESTIDLQCIAGQVVVLVYHLN